MAIKAVFLEQAKKRKRKLSLANEGICLALWKKGAFKSMVDSESKKHNQYVPDTIRPNLVPRRSVALRQDAPLLFGIVCDGIGGGCLSDCRHGIFFFLFCLEMSNRASQIVTGEMILTGAKKVRIFFFGDTKRQQRKITGKQKQPCHF